MNKTSCAITPLAELSHETHPLHVSTEQNTNFAQQDNRFTTMISGWEQVAYNQEFIIYIYIYTEESVLLSYTPVEGNIVKL